MTTEQTIENAVAATKPAKKAGKKSPAKKPAKNTKSVKKQPRKASLPKQKATRSDKKADVIDLMKVARRRCSPRPAFRTDE